MIPAYSSPTLHLANARCVAQGLEDGLLGPNDIDVLRLMVMDIRNAVYYAETNGWVMVETWLAQATEIIDTYEDQPFDDLDYGALKACLAEAACALR